ncbi:hypothetical protein SNE40_016789 [Patella caerulea]|uniref:Uncharacterized protein n=1 Tax=Patella caerulea TaxID=87958 RepID=A0AAN8JFE0_PATCE
MKFTSTLLKHNKRLMLKNVWKHKGSFPDRPPMIPQAVLDSGLEIVDPNVEEPPEPWVPPVPDDPQFKSRPSITELPNYNEEPAYVYTRGSRIMEGSKQACILTKSISFNGFPDTIKPLIGRFQAQDQDKLIQRYIMQSQKWDPSKEPLPKRIDTANVGYKFTREYGIPKKRSIGILMRNLIRLCQSTGDQFPSILSDLRLIPDAYLGSHYYYQGKLVIFEANAKYLLMSNQPMKAFEGEDKIDESVNQKLLNMYPLSPLINIPKRNCYRIQNIAGFQKEFSHSHPHTIFLINNNFWRDDSNQAMGLFNCFGYAVTQARKLYGNEQNLSKPICVQCVNMNQTTINFTFFQLNTTDFSSQHGVKNFVWFDSGNHLFQKQLPQPWRGEEYKKTYYHSYNPLAFEKLLAAVLGNAPEVQEYLDNSEEIAALS